MRACGSQKALWKVVQELRGEVVRVLSPHPMRRQGDLGEVREVERDDQGYAACDRGGQLHAGRPDQVA